MIALEAEITWKTESDGCVEQPFSGIRPSFAIGKELVTSRVESADGLVSMERGKAYEVIITLPYGERYLERIHTGMEARLQVGGRIIGCGVVKRVRD